MSEQNGGGSHTPSPELDRRTVLQYSVSAAAALAGAVIGSVEPTMATQGQASPAALGRPVLGARVRRVVTGHNAEGKSYIINDEVVPASNMWTTTAEQPLGAPPQGEARRIGHDTGETRCFVATIQPSRDPKPDLTNRGGFHITPGIAYCLILNGEIVLLTDTQEAKVKAGDIVVERNAFHSWRNETAEPVSMFIVTVNGAL
jgi:hypothetical protein